jgi:segregation and condensation protein B
MIYGTTREFLELFGLRDLAALPTLKEFSEITPDAGSGGEGTAAATFAGAESENRD